MAKKATSRSRREGGDPLPINLPTPPVFPGKFKPECAVPCALPFDSPEWRFSVEWEGSRTVLFVTADGQVQLQSETLDNITDRYPEIAESGAAFAGHTAVLEGVITVLDEKGRPDVFTLAERMRLGSIGAASHPTVFLATDLLYHQGASLMNRPLDRRLAILKEILVPDDTVQSPDDVVGEGRALADAALSRGLAALIARRRNATYHRGVASPDRLQIALTPQANCVVQGIETSRRRDHDFRIVLGEYADGHLVETGALIAHLDDATVAWARALTPAIATVSHRGRAADGRLREPELVVLRDDIDPLWCQRRAAVAPPEGSDVVEYGFKPTLIAGLPISD